MKRKSLPTGRDFLFVEGYGNENPGAFQSTRPLRGATSDHPWRNLWAWVFQPTRPLRGATRTPIKLRDCFLISTHAPLAGRDRSSIKVTINKRDFNPRAPCGARPRHIQRFARAFYFNPRAPCGARQADKRKQKTNKDISTHAPLAGRDSKSVQITMHIFAITDKFQMLLHRMPPVRAFCSFLMQETHADFGCEPPK